MHRLFVALRPPAAVRQQLTATMVGVARARWQDDEQLHLTLRFIGDVDRHQAADVIAALGRVSSRAPIIRLAGVGAFDNALWAGVAPQAPLVALHDKTNAALRLAGIPPERRTYTPHITLARLTRGQTAGHEAQQWLARLAALSGTDFRPDRLTLYESTLGREGARYETVAFWPLA
jgi:RNA 2',3'-cyclic 3'-phosphodiesterase